MSGCGIVRDAPGAQPLDAFLRQQFTVLQVIRDNMDAILRVASHLTPVEDLQDFKDEVEAIYPKLGLLVEASELIIQASDAGIALLLAIDVPAQRAALGLGSAALRNESYFALASAIPNLQTSISNLDTVISQIWAALATKVDRAEFLAVRDQLLNGAGGLGNRIDLIEQALSHGDYLVDIWAQVNQLNASMEDFDNRLVAQVSVTDDLALRVTSTESQFDTQLSAHSALALRVDATEEGFTSLANDVTLLQARATTLDGTTELQATAIQSLSTLLAQVNGLASTTSAQVTTLTGQLTDLSGEVQGNVEATEALTARVSETEQGIESVASDVTDLNASIVSGGNLLRNGGFEASLDGWELFSIGADWDEPVMDRVMLTESQVPALRIRNTEAGVTPLQDTGARSVNIPIEALSFYILSAYLGAENCTARLDYKVLDASFTSIFQDSLDLVTTPPASTLLGWQRSFAKMAIPFGGAFLQVQIWAYDPSGPLPTVYLTRAMLEEVPELQQTPSPWSPSAAGLQEALANARSELVARVEEAEGTIESLSASVTTLSASISLLPAVYVQATMPTGGTYSIGDYWFDSDDGNRQYIWNGTEWNDTGSIAGAVNYAQTTMPTGGSYNVGDQWIDTDDGNRLYRWNGSSWVDISDQRLTAYGTAISNLETRVTNAEGINASQSAAITSLTNTVTDPLTGLPSRASAAALTSLTTRVEAGESLNSSQSAQITQLQSKVNDPEQGNEAIANALTQLTTSVAETQSELDGVSQALVTRLNQIQADNILTPEEKPGVILDYQAILDEQAGIQTQATNYGATAELAAYNAAVSSLTSYLGGLTTPTMWNDVNGITYLN